MSKRQCHSLTVSEKLKVIKEVENGTKKKKDIAKEFGIPPNTLSTILKNKDKIKQAIEQNYVNSDKKRFKSTLPGIEAGVLQWMRKVRGKNLPISGTLLREKAEELGKNFGYMDFKASTGWLDKFKNRNGIVQKVICGESESVCNEDCKNYRNNILPSLIEEYSADDIFNADETGLYFKCLPQKTLAFKGESCFGGKHSKLRVTVLLVANMSGTEKLKPFVIGKSKKPRCFSGVRSLPVIYESNKKSWMTAELFETWLHKIDRKFVRKFFEAQEDVNDEYFKMLNQFDNYCENKKLQQKKQKTITDFFKV